MKKLWSLVLSATMVLSAFPTLVQSVKAESLTVNDLFGSTIDAPHLRYIETDDVNSNATIWYDSTEDLQKYGLEYYVAAEKYGLYSIEVAEQVDVSFDDEPWMWNSSWDDGELSYDWTNYYIGETNTNLIRNGICTHFYDNDSISAFGSYLKHTTDEWENDHYYADLENHRFNVRMRTIVKYQIEYGDEKVMFSDWSNTISVGKGGNQVEPTKPTKLDPIKLSNLKVLGQDEDRLDLEFFMDTPKSAYEVELYSAFADIFEPIYYEVEYSINDGPWEYYHIGNSSSLRVDSTGMTLYAYASDDIKIRARLVSDDLSLESPWSNVLWNKDICADGHTITHIAPKDPTCTERGNSEYWECSKCGKRFKDAEMNDAYDDATEVWIDSLGHNYTIELPDTAEDSDCQSEGHRNNVKCSRCDEWEYGETIPKKPHTYDNILESHSATCDDVGYEIRHCSSCDENITIETESRLGHDWDYENAQVVKKGTCIEVGQIKVVCKRDSSHTDIQENNEGGEHNWDEGKVQKAPTCDNPGEMLYTCKYDSKHTKTELIPKKGHDFSDKTSLTCKHCNVSNPNYSQKAAENAMAEKYNVDKDTLSITDSAIKGSKNDNDFKGSVFGKLKLRQKSVGKKDITVQWTKCSNADGYILYGNKCGKKNSYVELKTFNNKTTSYKNKGLKTGTYYKYVVRAYKLVNGKKATMAASKTVHISTKGGKNGNAKAVNVSKFKESKSSAKITLKKSKSVLIKAKELKKDKPISKHIGLRYESSNSAVATVSKSGKITAKKTGKCDIYVYAQNGLYKTIKCTVK